MDNIKTWTGLPVEESIRMAEDRDKWRKCVYGVADPRIKDEQQRGMLLPDCFLYMLQLIGEIKTYIIRAQVFAIIRV